MSMSIYLLFYGFLLLLYDLLAFLNYSSLFGLDQFRRIQQHIGPRQAHWALRLLAIVLMTAGIGVRSHYWRN